MKVIIIISVSHRLSTTHTGNAVGSITGQYDWALASKKFLAYEYFIGNARSIGSSSQNDFMNDVFQFKALGKHENLAFNFSF